MRLLLDTHTFLWAVSDPDRLSPQAAELIADEANEVRLSVASVWEIAIKYSLGKLKLPSSPATFVPQCLVATDIAPLPVELSHALAAAALPSHHRDPFDRLLIAQSQIERMPLISADRNLAPYDVKILW